MPKQKISLSFAKHSAVSKLLLRTKWFWFQSKAVWRLQFQKITVPNQDSKNLMHIKKSVQVAGTGGSREGLRDKNCQTHVDWHNSELSQECFHLYSCKYNSMFGADCWVSIEHVWSLGLWGVVFIIGSPWGVFLSLLSAAAAASMHHCNFFIISDFFWIAESTSSICKSRNKQKMTKKNFELVASHVVVVPWRWQHNQKGLFWNSTKHDTFCWCAWREWKQDPGKLESLYSPLGLRKGSVDQLWHS